MVGRRPSKPWGLSARAALWKAGGPPVSSPRWVAGLALTFLAPQCALQQKLPRKEFFLSELLGAAQGNLSISLRSLSPQDTAGGKLAWAKECCKQEFVFSQRESVRKPFFLCGGCFFFFFFLSFSPPQHICTEWEINATVSNMLAHRKVLEHPPSSRAASSWGNSTREQF